MPRVASTLSDIHVRRLKHTGPTHTASGKPKPVYVAVGGCPGLQIQLLPSGAKSWVLKTTVGKKRREIGLGAYSVSNATRKKKATNEEPAGVTLEAARKKGLRIVEQIKQGVDPVSIKKTKKSELIASRLEEVTFSELAQEWINQVAIPSWKTNKQLNRLNQYLKDYINPHIGNILVKDIEAGHCVNILKPIYRSKHPTALRVINYVKTIIDYGMIDGLRPNKDNPAIWNGFLSQKFAPSNKVHKIQHQKSIDWRLMPEFMPKLHALNKPAGIREDVACLIFQILTVARPSEARLADWSEIDLEQKVWFIPNSDSELRKSEKHWLVPLTKEAIKILKAQGPQKKGRIFNNDGKQIPNNYCSAIPKRLGYDATAHGFRSTFETWEQETQDKMWSPDAVRLAMKHTEGDKVRAAYARGQCYAERIRLMAEYEKWLYKGEGSISQLPSRKSKTPTKRSA